jgi:hypothetical protein
MAPQNPTDQFVEKLAETAIEDVRGTFEDLFKQALAIEDAKRS